MVHVVVSHIDIGIGDTTGLLWWSHGGISLYNEPISVSQKGCPANAIIAREITRWSC